MRRLRDADGTEWTCSEFQLPANFRQETEDGRRLVRVLVHCHDGRTVSLLAPPEWADAWSDADILLALRKALGAAAEQTASPEPGARTDRTSSRTADESQDQPPP